MDQTDYDPYTVTEETDRLIIRDDPLEHLLGCLMYLVVGPGAAVGFCLFLSKEVRRPGQVGREILFDKLGINPPNPESLSYLLIALFLSLLMLIFCGVLAWLGLRGLRQKWRHGRFPRILDRSQDLLILGDKPARSLHSIAHVRLTRDRVKLTYVYFVTLEPEVDPRLHKKIFPGLRDDMFSFTTQGTAEKFADRIATFLGVPVVNSV